MNIQIFLHQDRTRYGVLTLRDPEGRLLFSCACYGKSDNTRAKEAGNESRNPLRPFGDIPKGMYRARIVPSSGPGRVYGPHKRLLLTGVSGDALTALSPKNANGDGDRYNILQHGGERNAAKLFRPTHGCLRTDDPDQLEIITMMEAAGVRECDYEIIEIPF